MSDSCKIYMYNYQFTDKTQKFIFGSGLILSVLSFDSERFYLGKPCKKGHRFNDTEKCLRYTNNSGCVICARENSERQRVINPEKTRQYQREYQQKNQAKLLAAHREYWQRNREKLLENKKNYWQQNRERLSAKKKEYATQYRERFREYHQAYRQSYYQHNRDRIRAWHQEYGKQNRSVLRERLKDWRRTPRGRFSQAQESRKRRIRLKSCHRSSYTLDQVQGLYQAFEHSCTYCGSIEKLTLDHFLPISKGGSDCLGNLIPACGQCNSSKYNKDPLMWYKSQPFYSMKRWRQILKALGKTEANYAQIPLL